MEIELGPGDRAFMRADGVVELLELRGMDGPMVAYLGRDPRGCALYRAGGGGGSGDGDEGDDDAAISAEGAVGDGDEGGDGSDEWKERVSFSWQMRCPLDAGDDDPDDESDDDEADDDEAEDDEDGEEMDDDDEADEDDSSNWSRGDEDDGKVG